MSRSRGARKKSFLLRLNVKEGDWVKSVLTTCTISTPESEIVNRPK